MTTYLEYTTMEGDRWDLIAWRCYGDPYAYVEIVAVNRHVPIVPVLDGGLTIYVPLREPAQLDITKLPPWKR
jgi:phage tail protein X